MCCFQFRDGQTCTLPDAGAGFCYWHDPDIDKQGQALAEPLSELARKGHNLEGFRLSRADLRGVNLVNAGCSSGYSLRDADLYRADLRGAHLFMLDLRGASLMKADLQGCNLHCADLRKANLLGARWQGAKVENVKWGAEVLQETQARQLSRSHSEQRQDLYQQAEEIYRALHRLHNELGIMHLSGFFFYRERIVQRLQMPRWSLQRLGSWLVDRYCGYGERPFRVIGVSSSFILFCALLYWQLGIVSGGEIIRFDIRESVGYNLMELLRCVYFSVVTFTTLGYGDISPMGVTRAVAAIEAFIGSFTIAMFVVVFVRRMILSR